MLESEIYEKLTIVFRKVFSEDDFVLTPETTADDIDGWDSLNHVRLILGVADMFKVRFSASSVGNLSNVGELVSLIKSKVRA